ncbi:LamG domain-containing protein, partial [Candidatus Parcubacteria bacterium]
NGLVGYWSFDGYDIDWSSTTAEILDRSGNNNHGNAVGLTKNSATIGKRGQALSFDGDDYVETADIDITNTGVTVAGWVKLDTINPPDGVSQAIASKPSSYGLEINSAGKVTCVLATETKSWDWCATKSNTTLNTNNWYFVAFTEDANGYKYYVNGEYDGGGTDYKGTIITNDNNLFIGSRGYFSRFLDGAIDEVRIYNRALSADEIRRLYNAGTLKIRK